MTRDELRALAEELERSIYYTNHKAAAILRAIADAKPVAWRWLCEGEPDSEKCFNGTGPVEEAEWGALRRKRKYTVQRLYTLPLED